MNELFLLIFGLFVTTLAVGPLVYAAIMDAREEKNKKLTKNSATPCSSKE